MHACMHIHMYICLYVHAYVCIYAGAWRAANHGESALGTSGDVNGAISCARGVVSTIDGPEDAANVEGPRPVNPGSRTTAAGGGGGFGLVWVKACAGRPGPWSALAFVPTRLG